MIGVALAGLLVAAQLQAEVDSRQSLLDGMARELARNQSELTLRENKAPYFISYQLKEFDQRSIAARYGALFDDDTSLERKIFADVRVGDYQLDSSVEDDLGFSVGLKGNSYITRKNGPIDDSPGALRTSLWLVTDEKYKAALFALLKKKGEDVYRVDEPARPASFSHQKPEVFTGPKVAFSWSPDRWKALSRGVSMMLSNNTELFDSEMRVSADHITRWFVSSEGARVITEETLFAVHVTAWTRAADGQLLDDSRDWYAPTEALLPGDAEVRQAASKLVTELLLLRTAQPIDPYTGPAILEADAAGVMFHEAIGHRLEGARQGADADGKTFRGQLGNQVLAPFLSIADDPTRRELGGRQLNGFYGFDEEGVRAQKVQLIDSGVLKSYLMSRKPADGVLQSNGHGRSQGNRKPVARMANLIVESKKQVGDAELKRLLIAEAKRQGKPFGLIIRDLTGGNTNTGSFGYQAFKGVPRLVYRVDVRDGSETLVRGVEMVGTPLSVINKVLATGNRVGVFNGFCGAESGMIPVSASSPPVLLQEIELQRTVEGRDRPPILSSPPIEPPAH